MAQTAEHHCWLAVASAAHVRIGRTAGFMQVNHGKRAPLLRMGPGDGIVYYSPSVVFGTPDGYRSFTAIGAVAAGEPYQGDMGGGFLPFRRDVAWRHSIETPIAPLLEALELTRGKANWGYQLRFGLIAITAQDYAVIASAMQAAPLNPAA